MNIWIVTVSMSFNFCISVYCVSLSLRYHCKCDRCTLKWNQFANENSNPTPVSHVFIKSERIVIENMCWTLSFTNTGQTTFQCGSLYRCVEQLNLPSLFNIPVVSDRVWCNNPSSGVCFCKSLYHMKEVLHLHWSKNMTQI